jgi:hypothetical protein
MFRCDNRGSGYSVMAASAWDACPRCLAKENVSVPLAFELGWRGPRARSGPSAQADGRSPEPEGRARGAARS